MPTLKTLSHKVCLATIVVVLSLCACSPDDLASGPENNPFENVPAVSTRETQQATPSQAATTSPTEITSTPTVEQPTETPALPLAPILVVSFDGAANRRLTDWMNSGLLPTFSRFAGEGLHAEAMTTINPSLTAAAHASMVTGFFPDRTGIVSNLYHNPSDSFYWYRSGFSEPLDEVNPVWVTASQAGFKTASLFIAGGTPFLPGQTADYTVAYGARDAYSIQETLELQSLEENWEGEPPVSFSTPLETTWIIPKVSQVYLYAIDRQDDGLTSYDALILNNQRSFTDPALLLEIGNWGPLVIEPSTGAGAHFLLQEIITQDGDVQATLYHSGVYHNLAAPRELLEALNEQFGFFPASGDAYALEHGWITPEQFLEMLERSNRWMTAVTTWVYTTYNPDLTFTWLDAFDTAGHAFTPALPGMPGYDEETASQKEFYLEQAAWIADQALSNLLEEVPIDQATILLVSDHGMAPVHTTVNLNTLLDEDGWLVLDDRDYVVIDQSRVIAFASGGNANFYINLEGRDRDGFVSEEEYESIRQEIANSLSRLQNPDTGELVFSRVLLGEQLADLHLEHIHSGDIVAQANPGYDLDSHRGRWRLFEPTQFSGQHGYDCTLPDMEAIFIAAGAGISQPGQLVPVIHITDLAPTILSLLGLPGNVDMPGKVIPGLESYP